MVNHTVAVRALVAAVACCLLAGCDNSAAYEEAASKRSEILNCHRANFTLPDQNGNPVSLNKLRGQWVVLYFYPKDDTPACTCEATEFTRLLGGFRQANARIYGISPDSPSSHTAYIKEYNLKLDLLSDPNHQMMAAYGPWMNVTMDDKKYGGVIRTTMIIDPQGVICYHWPEVIPKGHAERVLRKLAQLQARPS